MNGLGCCVNATGPMKITAVVEQRQFHTGHFGESGIRFDLREPFRTVPFRKGWWRLEQELDALSADLDARQLSWCNHLKDHYCLMACPVKRRCTEQRNSVIDLQKLHQWIDPSSGIRSTK
jgi:hypothetical protein